jgi:iron complex outermembrane recepter protein
MMSWQRTRAAMAVGAGGCALLGAQPAGAQDIRISVTGTNIKRVNTETAAPIETITREDIQASGLQTISDVLRQITANNNGSISASFTNGYSTSGSAVSLRGLGPSNTLVLLNGRRLANFGLADDSHASYVDLQQIPFDAVERIEVLKDGASAIYGADAVAGVVNVILRQQYTGVSATATAGTTYNGNGNQYKGAVTAGVGDMTKDGYNAFVTFDGQRQEAIPSSSGRRYIGTNDLRFMGLPDLRFGAPNDFGNPQSSLLGNVLPVPNSAGVPLQALPGACPPEDQDGPYCRWDLVDFMDIQPTVERLNVFGRGTLKVANDVEAYAELSLFKVRTDVRRIPPSVRGSWYNPVTDRLVSAQPALAVGHPDNPFAANGQSARLFYFDGALGGGQATYDTTTQRYLVGAKGAARSWDFDTGILYIRSDTDLSRNHVFRYSRVLQGMDGTGPYGYYRIGASAAENDPAVYDWIAPPLSYAVVSENTIFDAKASRDLWKLDGGQLALALGYEFRREAIDNPGWPGADGGDVMNVDYVAASGARNVNSVFAEVYAPIWKNLEVTAAVRFDDYSDFGTTTNPKVGIKWTALPQLVLRGTYQTAFRAPGLYESRPSTLGGNSFVTDPVRCPYTQRATDCNGAIVAGLLVGNPNVQPEASTTYTAGVIWEPYPGTSATVDYWNIRTRNQITVVDAQLIVDDPGAYPQSTVERDPTNALPGIPNSGSILSITTPWANADSTQTDGIDVDLRWRSPALAWGTVTAELQWTHVFAFVQTLQSGASFDYAGTQGNYAVSSGAGTPKDRANLIVSWTTGPWSAAGTVRYVSGYQSVPYQGAQNPDGSPCLSPADGPDCHVASFTTLDLSAQYTGLRNWQIFGSIINVFNRIAPFNPAAAYGGVNYNYNYAFSGATGTQFNLGARYTFQ